MFLRFFCDFPAFDLPFFSQDHSQDIISYTNAGPDKPTSAIELLAQYSF